MWNWWFHPWLAALRTTTFTRNSRPPVNVTVRKHETSFDVIWAHHLGTPRHLGLKLRLNKWKASLTTWPPVLVQAYQLVQMSFSMVVRRARKLESVARIYSWPNGLMFTCDCLISKCSQSSIKPSLIPYCQAFMNYIQISNAKKTSGDIWASCQ